MQPLTNIAISAARRAGNVILAYYRRGETGSVTRKGKNDFVTEADQEAEATIIQTIRRAYPSHGFLAEESGASGDTETTWIIDPIDGTTNFMRGTPHFCVSIAVRVRGVLEAAVVFDPLKNELFTAERGKGAALDGRRIRTTRVTRLSSALVASGFALRKSGQIDDILPVFERLVHTAGGVRVGGSAALDLAWVAAGRYDAYWETGLAPWDMAAGLLLVRAAGGIVGDGADGDPLHSGAVLAAAPKIYPQLLEHVSPAASGQTG